jgi:pyruvate formate lyase activating enzyme
LPYYGRVSALALDPIEKKPLYHFRLGTQIFSVGFLGCNLRCPFCQNWEISQSVDASSRLVEPAELIRLAGASGAGAVAYTYSEPLVHIEYVIESMRLAREAGIANVLVTNGCVLEKPARAVLARCDAANVDLKAADPRTYGQVLGGDFEAVKAFIALAISLGVHVEATTLVVPGMNGSEAEIAECAAFLSALSPDLPYHLSGYHPDYNYREPATSPSLLARLAGTARESLRYVYVGNVPGESNDTRCPSCGALVVERRGYRIDTAGLVRSVSGEARCVACSAPLPFRF